MLMPNYLFINCWEYLDPFSLGNYSIEYLINIIKVILCKSSKLSMISINGGNHVIFSKHRVFIHKIDISISLEDRELSISTNISQKSTLAIFTDRGLLKFIF